MAKRKHRTRRKRRTQKQVQRYGPSAKRAHRKLGGRTGQISKKQPRSKKPLGLTTTIPFTVPDSIRLREKIG